MQSQSGDWKACPGTDAKPLEDPRGRRRSIRYECGGLPLSTRSSGNRCGKGTPPRRTVLTCLAGTWQTEHTVKVFLADGVEVEQYGKKKRLAPFQTVILASGMRAAPRPGEDIQMAVPKLEIIGDANEVQDVFTTVHADYELAQRY